MTSNSRISRSVIVGAAIFVATLLLLWIVGPRQNKDISMRVLFVSYSNDQFSGKAEAVKHEITSKKDSIVVIDKEVWTLSNESQQFYSNNIVLECSASFPIQWKVQGVDISSVTVNTARIVDNINDTSTYRIVTTANLMPFRETSSGKYICESVASSNLGNPGSHSSISNYFYIYFRGPRIFISQKNYSIELDNRRHELFIPCPVSDPTVPVQLIRTEEQHENLLCGPSDSSYCSYNPQEGFTLTTKFLEEKDDPWGTYICRAGDSGPHSGHISIVPPKEYNVRVTPNNSSILLTLEDFEGTFLCEAKESIVLQVSKIAKFRVITYRLNETSEYPFTARVNYDIQDLREYSSISCKSKATGTILHKWSFEDYVSATDNLEFYQSIDERVFLCCSKNSKIIPKLQILDCVSPADCLIRKACFSETSCSAKNKNIEDRTDCKLFESPPNSVGLLGCTVGDEFENLYYFSSELKTFSGKSFRDFDVADEEILTIRMFPPQQNVSLARTYKFTCKGSKFFLAGGFIWFLQRKNNLLELQGKGYLSNQWIHSWIDVTFDDYESSIIYCFAPDLYSTIKWKKAKITLRYS